MKIVYNSCYGGFWLSEEAINLAIEKYPDWAAKNIGENIEDSCPRFDPILVEIVETLGVDRASGVDSQLAIEDVPKGCFWTIKEYDGLERIEIFDNLNTWAVALW